MSSDKNSSNERTSNLLSAINDLNIFVKNNKKNPFSLILDLDIEDSNGPLLSKSRNMAFTFLSTIFSAKIRESQLKKRDLIQKRLFESVKYLCDYPLSETMTQLSIPVVEVVQLFNDSIKQRKKKRPFQQAIDKILKKNGLAIEHELKPIQLPRIAYLRYSSIEGGTTVTNPPTFLNHASEKISTLPLFHKEEIGNPSLDHDIRHHHDALKMKAIFKLRETAFRYALQTGKQMPMRTFTRTTEDKNQTICLKLVFQPLPGEIIDLEGNFKKYGNNFASQHRFVLDPESVRVTAASKQEGFPLHSTQHTGGFLLPHQLITYPHLIEKTPTLQALLKKKEEMAHDLLPEGKVNETAKKLMKYKKDAFEEHTHTYLSMHHALAQAIIKAAPKEHISSYDTTTALDHFFSALREIDPASSYSQLSTVYQQINEQFIVLPYTILHEQWLTGKSSYLLSEDRMRRSYGCSSLFLRTIEGNRKKLLEKYNDVEDSLEQYSLAFTDLMGSILGQAACAIAVQQFSEKLNFAPPPPLRPFDKLIQACLYEQLSSFIQDLKTYQSMPTIPFKDLASIHQILQRQLETEADLFNGIGNQSTSVIVDELEQWAATHHNH